MKDEEKVGEYYQAPRPKENAAPGPKPFKISNAQIRSILDTIRARQRGEISDQEYADFISMLSEISS